MKDELYHHGILGQKWGVRRFQNPDGSLTEAGKKRYGYGYDYDKSLVLKKGTSLYRTSFSANETNSGRTYAAFKTEDANKYASNGKLLAQYTGGEAYQYKLKATEDLKAPSRKEMVDIYLSMLKDNDKLKKKSRAAQEAKFDKVMYNLVKDTPVTREYFERVVANGYNMLMDNADMKQGISKMPVIILDRGKSLVVDEITELSGK